MSPKPSYEELEQRLRKLENAESLRKQASKELADQKQLVKALLDNLNVGVFMVDAPSGTPILVNRTAIDLLGRGIEKGTDKDNLANVYNAYQLGTNDYYPIDKMPVIRGMQGESRTVDDMVVISPDGNKVLLEVHGSPVRDQEGNVVASLASFSDITERHRAEDVLRKSEEKYRLLADNIIDSIWTLDLETLKLTYLSPSIKRITGYSADEIIGLHLEEVLTPSSIELATGVLSEELSAEEQTGNSRSRTLELELYHKHGTTVWTEASMRFIRDDQGLPTSILGVTRDISERRRLQNQLSQAQKMESIGTLAGGIAHDFNNILSAILGYTELSLFDAERGTLIEKNLQKVNKAGMRARDLVWQILAFARQSKEEKKPLQVKIIASEVLKFIRSTIPATIVVKENIDSKSVIMGNPSQIHQLFMNLCTNAAQAMEEAGGTLEVALTDVTLDDQAPLPLSDLKPGNYLKTTVSDTGPGISADIIDSIFEPYFTTKGVGEGTGMGLALTHGIVESCGGKITVDSEVGRGAVFSVYLPVATEYEDHPSYEKQDLAAGSENILFVDDERNIADIGSQLLERLGYEVSVRTSSVEALELFRSKPSEFDLVITDMTMPNMTGDKLAVEIMKIRRDIPIILCTGYSKKISEQTAAKIGIKAIAMKPIVNADLSKTVRKVLDEAKGPAQGKTP